MSSLTVGFKIIMCVFRPVLQRFGSDIAHVLPVKAGGCGSSANQCTARVKMTSRVGKHESSYNAIFSDRAIFKFPAVYVSRAR